MADKHARSGENWAFRRKEAAEKCGVSVSTFNNWIAKGMIIDGTQIDGVRIWEKDKLRASFEELLEKSEFGNLEGNGLGKGEYYERLRANTK